MLGQKVVAEAKRRNLNPICVARRNAQENVDIANEVALASVFAAHNPKLIINCAGIIDIAYCEKHPMEAYMVNARAVGILARMCAKANTKLVQISTEHYFTGDKDARHNEDHPVELVNEYARTKFAGEAYALSYPNALVARVNIVGLRGWGKATFTEWAIKVIENNLEASMFNDNFASSVDTTTCAKALFDLSGKNATGLYNLGSKEVFTKKAFIEELAQKLGKTLTNAKVGSVKSLEILRAESLGLDVSKAENKLGYSLPTLKEVILNLVNDYKAVL